MAQTLADQRVWAANQVVEFCKPFLGDELLEVHEAVMSVLNSNKPLEDLADFKAAWHTSHKAT